MPDRKTTKEARPGNCTGEPVATVSRTPVWSPGENGMPGQSRYGEEATPAHEEAGHDVPSETAPAILADYPGLMSDGPAEGGPGGTM